MGELLEGTSQRYSHPTNELCSEEYNNKHKEVQNIATAFSYRSCCVFRNEIKPSVCMLVEMFSMKTFVHNMKLG